MPRLNHAADSLRALALVTQHHNSRVCKSDAECMQTVWRSSSLGLRETAVLLPRICQPPHRAGTVRALETAGVWMVAGSVLASPGKAPYRTPTPRCGCVSVVSGSGPDHRVGP